MTMTNAATPLAVRLSTWLASMALIAAFVPSIVASLFLGGQAWYAFTGSGSYAWGTLCAALLVVPFVASPASVLWARKRGMSWAAALLVGAAIGFAATCAGIFLGVVTAALGGM